MAERIFSDATVRLSPSHIQLAKDVKVGSKVRMVLSGTVKEVRQKVAESVDDAAQLGEIILSVSTVKIASNSEIADLFEEDLDG